MCHENLSLVNLERGGGVKVFCTPTDGGPKKKSLIHTQKTSRVIAAASLPWILSFFPGLQSPIQLPLLFLLVSFPDTKFRQSPGNMKSNQFIDINIGF